jgi:uncharacterized protein
MQNSVSLKVGNLVLRGMEHIPDGSPVASRTFGTGGAESKLPAVILYHGFTGNKVEPHRMFLKLARLLEAKGIACFRFDFSGSGESDGNFEDMTVSGEIDEAKHILTYVRNHDRVDMDRISILGLSLGGLIAGIVAGDESEAVHKLVLLAPAGNMNDIVANMARQEGVNLSDPYFDRQGDLVGRNFAIDVGTIRSFERAKPFQKSVLLVHGTADMSVPYQVSFRYRDEVYGETAQVHIVEGADHTFNSHPWETEVLQTVVAFLTV